MNQVESGNANSVYLSDHERWYAAIGYLFFLCFFSLWKAKDSDFVRFHSRQAFVLFIAECVASSPGGPVHVLQSDQEAEHIPGCNMAFRRDCLQEIGGFDEQFRVAGDDVDVCWRIQERGWKLGFSPAAMVWHHRRNSLRTYWKQQKGYGKAEALLENKWPEKYNAAGHITWGDI